MLHEWPAYLNSVFTHSQNSLTGDEAFSAVLQFMWLFPLFNGKQVAMGNIRI